METNLEIRHDKDDQMWYVYDKTDDNHEYIFDYFSDVSRWVESGGYFDRLMIFDAQTTEDQEGEI